MNIQPKAQQGFTLIELMIVIAIIGILAAIALPAYQDYTVRAKMSEPIAALSEAKTAYTEYYSANGYLPENQAKSGIGTARYGEYVNLITVSDNSEFITATVPGGIIRARVLLCSSLHFLAPRKWMAQSSGFVVKTLVLQAMSLPSTFRLLVVVNKY